MRKIRIARLATTTPQKFINIELYYCQGGPNFMSGGYNKRGYRLSVTPITDNGDGGISWMITSGIAHTVEETKRFNAKRMAELAALGDKLPQYQACIDHVLAKEGLTLEPCVEREGFPVNEPEVAEVA